MELSPVKQTAKKSKDSQSLNEEKMEQLVERLVDERLETCLEAVLDRVFDRKLDAMLDRKLNTMLEKLEERFSSTIDKRLPDMVTYVDSVSASSEDQMDILKRKIADLELRADMSEVEGNLIISGIEEAIDEDVKVRVLDLVQNELKVNISEQEIVSAFRLPNGQRAAPRQTSTSPTNSPTSAVNRDAPASQSTPLPRRILVKTVSHTSKAKIMRAKSALVKDTKYKGIFFNHDLSKREQQQRRQLVPVYKTLHSIPGLRSKCKWERAVLVIDGQRCTEKLSAEKAAKRLRDELGPAPPDAEKSSGVSDRSSSTPTPRRSLDAALRAVSTR